MLDSLSYQRLQRSVRIDIPPFAVGYRQSIVGICQIGNLAVIKFRRKTDIRTNIFLSELARAYRTNATAKIMPKNTPVPIA